MIAIPAPIADKLLGIVLDFLKKGGESLVKNISAKKAIKKAIERATERFGTEYSDQDLAKALTVDTKFYDLPSVQKAIRELLEHPFDHAPQIRIEDEFAIVLPASQRELANQAVQIYFEILREELIGVEKLTDKLKLVYLKRTAEATERTAHGIEELVAERKISQAKLSNIKEKYLQYIVDNNTYVDPRGIMQTRRSVALKLNEIYVSLIAERDANLLESTSRGGMFSAKDDGNNSLLGKDGFDEIFRESIDQDEVFDLAAAIRENSRLVILGDPGAGKTTLLRFLALRFAQTCMLGNFPLGVDVKDDDGNDYGAPRIPVYIRIANYADTFAKDRRLGLREFLCENFGDLDVPKEILHYFLEQTVRDGKAIILLDGLDEIVDPSVRSEVARRVEQLIFGGNIMNKYVITSRIAGYRSAPLAGDFAHFTLRGLERSQIQKFLLRWCPAVEKAQTPDASQSVVDKRASAEIEGILRSVDENLGVRQLASNPLMLTILALIHRAGARLPSRRVELYELAVKTLLEDWELARGIPEKKIVKENEALRLLGPLAFWLHENKPRGLASEREVKQQFKKTLSATRNLPFDSEEIESAVDDFLKRVHEHTGIFVERAPMQYGFMHLTFEEYFASRELIRKRNDVSRNIYLYRHKPRWDEPILLAVAFLSNDYPDDAVELISTGILAKSEEASLQGFTPSPYEDVLHRDLLFAVRAVGDGYGIDLNFIDKILVDLFHVCFKINQEGRSDTFLNHLSTVLVSIRGSELAKRSVEILLNMLPESDYHVRMRIADLLGWLGIPDDQVVHSLLNLLNDENKDVRLHAASALGWLNFKNDLIVSSLIRALKDENSEVCWKAVHALGWLDAKDQEIVSEMLNLVANANEYVCGGALYVLSRFKVVNDAVLARVLIAMRDERSKVRWSATTTVGQLGVTSEEIVKSLLVALQDTRWYVRSAASRSMANLGLVTEDVISYVVNLAQSRDINSRRKAVSALGHLRIRNDAVVKVLLQSMNQKDKVLRGNAAAALGWLQCGEKEVLERLIIALRDERAGTRQRSAEALGFIGAANPEVIDSLLVAVSDKSPDVRRGAIASLGRLGVFREDVIQALVRALHDSNNDVCFHAISALSKLDNVSDSMITELQGLLSHSQEFVCVKAAQALAELCVYGNSAQKRSIQTSLYSALLKSQKTKVSSALWQALWDATS